MRLLLSHWLRTSFAPLVLAGLMLALDAYCLQRNASAQTVSDDVNKYLVFDSRVLESTQNVELVLGEVKKHPGNPLFAEDKPWEQRFDNLYANVVYDDVDGLYKCWYSPFIVDHSAAGITLRQRNETTYRPPPDRETGVCYAVSQDGLKWDKPALNLVEFDGNKSNNIVLRRPHGAGVYMDASEADPMRRYKMFHARDALRFSADGLHWSEPLVFPEIQSKGDTHNNLLRLTGSDQYAVFVRLRDHGQRTIGRSESGDLQKWTGAVEVLRGDAKNQTYSMPVFPYAGVYLGLVAIFRTQDDRVHTELAWSPDTILWHRIQPGTPFIANAIDEGDYDWGCVYAAASPLVHDDEIRIYYGGSNGKHFGWREGFFCLATMRKDHWAGFRHEGSGQGAVVFKPVKCHGTKLAVTGDAQGGSIKVFVTNSSGHQVANPATLTENKVDQVVIDLSGSSEEWLAVRFEVTDATIYSFSFQK